MNLNALSTTQMVSVTGQWVGEQRALFLSIPKIAPYFEDILFVHEQLMNVDRMLAGSEAVARLTRALTETDRRHDDAVRCVFDTLSAVIRFFRIQDPVRSEDVERLEKLLQKLLPEGLHLVRRSYRDEAGHAESMLNGLDAATRQALREIPVVNVTLLEVVVLWGELGRKLGQLESQRSILVASAPVVATEKEVRSTWLQAVKQVLNGLDLVKDRAEAVIAIRQPVLDAEAAAVARAGRRDANAATEPAPAEPAPAEAAASVAAEASSGAAEA